MQIFMQTLSGKIVTLEVGRSDEVKRAKEILQDKEGILPNRVMLIHNGKPMLDRLTLAYYSIGKESTIHIVMVPSSMLFQIDVELIERAKTVTINHVTSSTPITDIKAVFTYEEHLPLDHQVLKYEGKVLQNGHTVGDYKICNGSTLQLVTRNSYNCESTMMINQMQNEHKGIQRQMQQLRAEWEVIQNEQQQSIQGHIQHSKGQWKDMEVYYQSKVQNLETLVADLKLQLDVEKEQTKKLQEELSSQKVKAHLLEQNRCVDNAAIMNLVERVKGLEDTVERLWAISRDEVLLSNKILGTGGWGYVKEATYRGRRVAAKCLHEVIVSHHNQELFAKEMKISARCRHRNLVDFIGAVPDHPAIIVTELMDSTLRAALANRRATPNHIHPISMDVAQGLLYLHSIQPHSLIHRDVSAPNVLLKASENGWIAKLSDLGSAQFANLAQTLAPGCFLYAAPEVRQEDSARQQTVKIDVYSFGVLLIEMLTREMPTGSIEALVQSVQSRWPRFVPLIISCTVTDPNQRPTMRQVIDQLDTIIV